MINLYLLIKEIVLIPKQYNQLLLRIASA